MSDNLPADTPSDDLPLDPGREADQANTSEEEEGLKIIDYFVLTYFFICASRIAWLVFIEPLWPG